MSIKSKLFHAAIKLDKYLACSLIFCRASVKQAETVFFPGCSLMSYSPEHVKKVQAFIAGKYKSCGVLTGCCAKPLKLMRDANFNNYIDNIIKRLDVMGAKRVITACPNCFNILKAYGDNKIEIISLWNLIAEDLDGNLGENLQGSYSSLEASVQDSCAVNNEVMLSVRKILKFLGVKVCEMEHIGRCCGGIAAITSGDAEIGRLQALNRASEAPCEVIITYCASCRAAMSISKQHKSIYLLDLIFNNVKHGKGWGLLNRLKAAWQSYN